MVRTRRLPHLLFLLATVGCNHKTVDSVAARKLSDEFMSDLIAHRTDAAFDKMEPEFTKMVNRSHSKTFWMECPLIILWD